MSALYYEHMGTLAIVCGRMGPPMIQDTMVVTEISFNCEL